MNKNAQKYFHWLALFGYFGLLIWVPVWNFFLTTGLEKSTLFIFIMWIFPLLLPLRGIIKNNAYTYAWANFVVMIYLLHAMTSMYTSPDEIGYAAIELVLALSMFVGCSFYARMKGKEQGLTLKKLKDVMAEEKIRFEGE